jgi:hypothetical protein
MKTDEESRVPIVTFRAHPPERRLRSLARGHIAGCCCCCCCCCCLHSLGSITGAIVGSFYPPPAPGETESPTAKLRDDELDGPARAVPAGPPGTSNYWLSTLAVTAGAALVSLLVYGLGSLPGVLAGLVVFLPLVQLGGSLLCALVIAVHPQLSRRAGAWERLGWITLGSVVGCVIGIVVMVVLFRR